MMDSLSDFFVQNIIAVFFFYGLAFFALGLALLLASRRPSEFRFAQAIRPLAAFGIVHGGHEWFEMFQKIAALSADRTPTVLEEVIRVALLAGSFLLLAAFGVALLSPEGLRWPKANLPVWGMAGVWVLSTVVVAIALRPPLDEMIALADVLARYLLAIPGALVGAWAMMAQQRTFREHGMPQFGRDLVWCATALLLYGVVGQFFVRQTRLVPSAIINYALFLRWFGIPVQVFRAVMATTLAIYMTRALNAFELENQRRLEEANKAKLAAQAATLEAERRTSRERERLNRELRQTARELSLLLDLSNLLAAPVGLQEQVHSALEEIVRSLDFPDAAMILLVGHKIEDVQARASVGFPLPDESSGEASQFAIALELGKQCAARGVIMCRHQDGLVFEFVEGAEEHRKCQEHPSPTAMISLPLTARQQVVGGVVFGQIQPGEEKELSLDEFELILGIARQLGLSIENARLYREAQEREKTLGELLHQVVAAQEAERQRIARELHDATGQSLTAIALGLRGVESMLASDPAVAARQIRELKVFGTNALGELRQIISDLRPPQLDDLGLVAALQWYVQGFAERRSIQTDFIVEGDGVRLSPEYEIVLFRIIQEALTNIAKHANASRSIVRLQFRPGRIKLGVEDDGCGFDPAEVLRGERPYSGWGLLGIRERAALLGGRYEIDSEPGRGTRVWVDVPLGVEMEKDVKDTTVAG